MLQRREPRHRTRQRPTAEPTPPEGADGARPSGRDTAVDLALGFAPIALLGGIGTAIGAGSPVGIALIHSGYLAALAVAGWRMRRRGSGWLREGLARPRSVVLTALAALGAAVGALALFVTVQLLASLVPAVASAPIDDSRFDAFVGDPTLLALSLLAAWTTIAFGEEMMFRAFLVGRLRALWRGRWGAVRAVAVAAAAFGLAHAVEGPVGIVSNGAFGALFGAIYLASGRNLWITVVAHGLLNTLRFVLVFAGAA